MKKFVNVIISVYQLVFSPLLRIMVGQNTACRYSPTCSQYAKEVIATQGVLKGSSLVIKRLLSCQPFAKNQQSYV